MSTIQLRKHRELYKRSKNTVSLHQNDLLPTLHEDPLMIPITIPKPKCNFDLSYKI